MRDSLKRLIEDMGGTVLMDGTLIQFGEESFERLFRHVYEAGMAHSAQTDNESDSSGGSHGPH